MTFDEWWDIKASTINKALKNNRDYIKPFFENAYIWGKETGEKNNTTKQDLEKDILILVLRLMGSDPDTFSPEVAEVMERWSYRLKEDVWKELLKRKKINEEVQNG